MRSNEGRPRGTLLSGNMGTMGKEKSTSPRSTTIHSSLPFLLSQHSTSTQASQPPSASLLSISRTLHSSQAIADTPHVDQAASSITRGGTWGGGRGMQRILLQMSGKLDG
ncbi:hypothetical protein Pmani_005849 [Petrolisthes manimaculis]|uniref:Uncharacterized protein n=1 Tax=Petrolisthes manimaculis TaxID=1843537 RepID=A0AAE1QBW1_9EUCA|nr:hypothetical protein Pmani_005849 [Petrolisthes manimaculis]